MRKVQQERDLHRAMLSAQGLRPRNGQEEKGEEAPVKFKQTSKYMNRKTGGFDSRKEKRRWEELLLLQRAGKIRNLRRQVPFEIVPVQREAPTRGTRGGLKPGPVIERAAKYVADFVYTDAETGAVVVEDVKGYRGGEAYAHFVLKRKLMLKEHGIRIREV